MKTINNLFNEIICEQNLRIALRNAGKGKRNIYRVNCALSNEDEIIGQLRYELENDLWRPKQVHSIKIINDGIQKKKREIVCPDFLKEQVVHHAIMQVCKPYFINRLYKHSYASVPKYGGLENMVKYIRHAMKDRKGTKYHAKLDIKQFFNSIRPSTVFHVLRRIVRDKKTLWLFARILRANKINHPELGVIKRGCPIGLYTSQWFANILLTPLDNLIKSFGKKTVPYYARYNDDMLVFSPNKRKLKKVIEAVVEHLSTIGLRLKHEPQIHMTSKNKITYVGSLITYDNITMKPKTFIKTRRCLTHIKNKINNHKRITSYDAKRAFAYISRCRIYDMHNFVADFEFPLDKFKRIISYSDKKDVKKYG